LHGRFPFPIDYRLPLGSGNLSSGSDKKSLFIVSRPIQRCAMYRAAGWSCLKGGRLHHRILTPMQAELMR
jgi:hypothetical protein